MLARGHNAVSFTGDFKGMVLLFLLGRGVMCECGFLTIGKCASVSAGECTNSPYVNEMLINALLTPVSGPFYRRTD